MRCPLMHPSPNGRGCDWCGTALPKRCRRWCSRNCETAWWNNHVWTYARAEALRRAEVLDGLGVFVGWRCAGCGGAFRLPGSVQRRWSAGAVEVNHKTPVLGRHGEAGCHHHQSGLEVLCPPCHRDVTARQRARGWTRVSTPVAAVPQMALFD